MEDRRQWKDDFEVLKENNYYSKILYTANISFKNEDEIKAAEKNLREFSTSSPTAHQLQETDHAPRVTGDRSKLGKSKGKSMGTRMLRTGLKLESVSQKLTTAVPGPIS